MKYNYFEELARCLAEQQIQTEQTNAGCLSVLLNGENAVTVMPNSLLANPRLGKDGDALLSQVRQISTEVHEYISAIRQAPTLEVKGLDEGYRQLAAYNDTVLAGKELESGHGYQFVVWEWNAEHTGLNQGDYFINGYTQAKEDFAARSGLVAKEKLFNEYQLAEIYRAVQNRAHPETFITEQHREQLKQVMEQIEASVPNLTELLKISAQQDNAVWEDYITSEHRECESAVFDDTFEHVEIFGKPMLLCDGRIDRNTVPEGWFVYELRGSDYDPGDAATIENHVAVNFCGSVLTPEEILFPENQDYAALNDSLNYLGFQIGFEEFCDIHDFDALDPQWKEPEAGGMNLQ